MSKHVWSKLMTAALVVVGVAGIDAPAQPLEYRPGSILLYPQYDSRRGLGMGTVIAVTNTNGDRRVRANNMRVGDVQLHYFYVEGTNNWQVFDRIERLTPNDMHTVIVGDHNPQTELGFLLVIAEDPEVELPISFNYLIGDEILVDILGNRTWSIAPIPFQALTPFQEGLAGVRTSTDANANAAVDFDGVEYDLWPDRLYMARFFQQSAGLETELILVSLLGRDFRISVNFLFYDNEEDVFSRSFTFTCWTSVVLSNISLITRNLGGRAGEAQTGWARIDGDFAVNVLTGALWTSETGNPTPVDNRDPPLAGAYVERILPGPGFEYGHLLHHTGSQNGNEFPPDAEN